MAVLQLKILIQLNVQGDRLYVTDKTGIYDATDNTGGWGSPNPSLNKSALAVLVQRVSETITEFLPVGTSVTFNPAALDSDETTLEFFFTLDGHIKVTEFRLPVSDDGSVDMDGTALDEEAYFYYNGEVNQIQSGLPVVITDLSVMLGDGDVVQATCEDLLYPQLKKEAQQIRLDYKNQRESCDDGSAEETFQEFRNLYFDLIGTDWDFAAGLVVQAERNIDRLLKQYELV